MHNTIPSSYRKRALTRQVTLGGIS